MVPPRYMQQVYKQVADLQVSKGGPLLMVQIDNEYGITDPQLGPKNNDYLVALNKIFKDVGFETQLFVCNPTHAPEWTDPNYRIPGVMICRNGLSTDAMFKQSADAIGDYLGICAPEVYPAWFLKAGATASPKTTAPRPPLSPPSWTDYVPARSPILLQLLRLLWRHKFWLLQRLQLFRLRNHELRL